MALTNAKRLLNIDQSDNFDTTISQVFLVNLLPNPIGMLIPILKSLGLQNPKRSNERLNNPTRRRRRSFGLLKLELGVLDFGIQDSVSHGISPIQAQYYDQYGCNLTEFGLVDSVYVL